MWRHWGGVFRAAPTDADLASAAASLDADGTVLEHRFQPHGISLAVLGRSVRVAMHTWPEYQVVTVDVYSRVPMDVVTRVRPLGWILIPSQGSPRASAVDADRTEKVS